MTFTRTLWSEIEPLYQTILAMPFNQELAAGTLKRERFIFYMLQDAHYLTRFGRALASIAARAPDTEAMIQFAGSAKGCIVVERALHEGFFEAFGIESDTTAKTKPSPTCSHYTSFLTSTAHNAPYEVAVAAVLPCFWIYLEVGRHLLSIAKPDNPYQAWIDTYADDGFAADVDSVVAITDRIGKDASPWLQSEMKEAFITATKLEWMFWDSAYRLEDWPV